MTAECGAGRRWRALDRGAARAGARAPAPWLGGAQEASLVAAGAPAEEPAGGGARRAGGVQKNLCDTLAEEQAKHALPVELWATDEHRLGLKQVRRRVWAPVGERPTALGHHRFEWLYVTAFVAPESGETVWYLSNGIDKRLYEMMLASFARETGAGRDRIIVLLLDGAGWHTEPNLAVPDGIRLVYLPPYTPELQPAEHLWPLVDEPIANTHFDTLADLEAVLAERCRTLRRDRPLITANTNCHWWPKTERAY